MVQGEIKSQGVTLRIAPPHGLPPAVVDRIQLQRIVLNLVMNATEAMSAVTGRARTLTSKTARHGADALCVAVRDAGSGLSLDGQDRLFEAFHTTKPHGMGLGLAISRSIVEAHGGQLWATPNDSPGATFQFTLPVQPQWNAA
jgi:signal transduction histidine kinase